MKDNTRKEILAKFRELVEMGWIEPTGEMRDGQLLYAPSEKGRMDWTRSALMGLCAAGTICRTATHTGEEVPEEQMPACSEEIRKCLDWLSDGGAIELGVVANGAGGTVRAFSITDEGFALLPRSEQERFGDARLIIFPPPDQPVREKTPEEAVDESLLEVVKEKRWVVRSHRDGTPH